jgi:hypothetical protein
MSDHRVKTGKVSDSKINYLFPPLNSHFSANFGNLWVYFHVRRLQYCQEGIKEKLILPQFYQGPTLLITQKFSQVTGALSWTILIFNGILYHYLNGTLAKPNWSVANKWQSWIKTTWTVPVCQRSCFQIATGVNASAAVYTEADASMWHEGNGANFH